MAAIVRQSLTAGIAIAGASFWLASAQGAPAPSATPALRLVSVDSPLPLAPAAATPCGELFCPSLFGSALSTSARPRPTAAPITAAASPTDPLGALIAVFISDGTAEHPDAGLLIGNGYQGAPGQRGGNGGLLFGNGGAGGGGMAGVNNGAGGLIGGAGATGPNGTNGTAGDNGQSGSDGTAGHNG